METYKIEEIEMKNRVRDKELAPNYLREWFEGNAKNKERRSFEFHKDFHNIAIDYCVNMYFLDQLFNNNLSVEIWKKSWKRRQILEIMCIKFTWIGYFWSQRDCRTIMTDFYVIYWWKYPSYWTYFDDATSPLYYQPQYVPAFSTTNFSAWPQQSYPNP